MTPPDDAAMERGGAFDDWCREHVAEQAVATRATRGRQGSARFEVQAFAQADVLSAQFADGSVLHMRPQDFLAQLPAPALAAAARGSQAAPAGEMELPFDWEPGERAAGGTRGNANQQVERYALAKLTQPSTLDRLYDFGALVADGLDRWFGSDPSPAMLPLAAKLCHAFENSRLSPALKPADSGVLLSWRGGAWVPVPRGERIGPAGDKVDAGSAPASVLLLLHGTFSSTQGSFGALWTEGATGGRPSVRSLDALARDHVLLAWDHRSLTHSPLQNTMALLQALRVAMLPERSEVKLLSHSRGGMVGDLLGLALVGAGDAGDASDGTEADRARALGSRQQRLDAYRKIFRDSYGPEHPDAPRIDPFFDLLQTTPCWRAGTFVRVASPARGTLLADRRTDFFLSLVLRSAGLAFGTNGVPAYEQLNSLVKSLVAARAQARELPGLEAMIPGSPLTLALNTLPPALAQAASAAGNGAAAAAHAMRLPGRLRVVAGDTRDRGWGGITSFIGNIFYGLHDHDFVVHTHSMFGGFERNDAMSHLVADATVGHLSYFLSTSLTRQPLLAALAGRDESFRPLREDEASTRGLWQALARDPLSRRPREQWLKALAGNSDDHRPILVVLPGIMGSELADADDAQGVWLPPKALLNGQLSHLQPAQRLEATGLMPVGYERLLKAASERYRLLPFAFDWRASIADSGAELLSVLKALPARETAAVHVLAHSMGGLVARAALYDDTGPNPLWKALRQRGSRLLMLGTPNAGSYAPVQLLVQQHAMSQLLASLSRGVKSADLSHWGGRFHGLMEMLPEAADPHYGNLFMMAAWSAMQADDALVQPPDAEVLDRARAFRTALNRHLPPLRDDEQVLYVAGTDRTPVAVLPPSRGWPGLGEGLAVHEPGLRFAASDEGDGTVSWASVLNPQRTWYSPVGHAELADDPDSFAHYFDLLERGHTRGLQAWATRSAAPSPAAATGLEGPRSETTVLPRATQLPSWPADLGAYALGLRPARPGVAPALRPIEVRVAFGSLDYARYPLLVGHYQGDGVLGAALRVDEKLDGQLSHMIDLKLFAGAARTAIYLRPPSHDHLAPAYPGAVVVGLGTVGELTPGSLADTVTRGVLRHAFEHVNRDPWVPADGPVQLRLSSLLIGTHVQAVTARDSLAGVLQGVWRAGQILAQPEALGRPVQIAEVEIVEIEEHRALDAAYELRRLLGRAEWSERLVWPRGELETRVGGIRGYQPGNDAAVWQRLCVRHDQLGGLKFELIGERARVESTQVYSDVASLAHYIARVSDEGAVGRSDEAEQRSLGRVLYQLLLPQNLKSRLANFDNTVLVLDDQSAGYPWELLAPPDDGLDGDGIRPLAVQAGMVRQRLTYEFRNLPLAGEGWNALVIGAPATMGWVDEQGQAIEFKPLPGARAEADAVRRLLQADARPWCLPAARDEGLSFEKVRTALLERPWRVLHLCGHGVVDQWVANIGEATQARPLRKTGMLLSHQQVLTAGDVEQMDPVPEFVFINCCYSGQDGTEARSLGQRNYPKLAASLAMQFIQMGSKAVVAAGWQVDDGDGLAFATSLYQRLLEGETLGEAVRASREAIYPRGGQRGSNTWGAYQCYGDPQWRLADARQTQSYADRYGSSRLREASRCMSPAELAERILQVVAVAGDKPRDALLMQLEELRSALQADAVRREWLRSSAVRAALGEAYRELGDHASAVLWFQRGARNAYSRVQLRQIELMVNSMSRQTDAQSHRRAKAILQRLQAIDEPSLLVEPLMPAEHQAASAGSERACLLGSSLMRQVDVARGARGRRKLLLAACAEFLRGYVEKLEPRDLVDRRTYALSSALLCAALARAQGVAADAVLALLAPLMTAGQAAAGAARMASIDPRRVATAGAAIAPTAAQVLQACQQHCHDLLAEAGAVEMASTFWHYTNRFELTVAQALLCAMFKLDFDPQRLVEAERLFDRALVRWPSPSERESVALRFVAIVQHGAAARTLASGAGQPITEVLAASARMLAKLHAQEKRRR